jgi:hypothetical protein
MEIDHHLCTSITYRPIEYYDISWEIFSFDNSQDYHFFLYKQKNRPNYWENEKRQLIVLS